MILPKCTICEKDARFSYAIGDGIKSYCAEHKSQAPIRHGTSQITDATGKIRDRDWLSKKLDMTRTEKKWHEDIKSRKLMPDGTIRRIKK